MSVKRLPINFFIKEVQYNLLNGVVYDDGNCALRVIIHTAEHFFKDFFIIIMCSSLMD